MCDGKTVRYKSIEDVENMEDVRWPIEVGYFMVSYLRYYEFTKHGFEHGLNEADFRFAGVLLGTPLYGE